ncbi:hypothetical protein ACLHDG_13660 [Sulfurovum sp. CS9]|uniref:hypothetical protein n=1 Tax=Sulfurovum sp. CS9 TaxID=3391146 RepID=UPI0039EB8F0C
MTKLSQEENLLILKMLMKAITKLEEEEKELTFFQAKQKKNIKFRIEAIHQIGDRFDSKLNIDLSKLSKIEIKNILIILTSFSKEYNNPKDKDMYLSFMKTINTIKRYIEKARKRSIVEKIELSSIEKMQHLAENIIDTIISADKHIRIDESYEDFIKVFEEFPSFQKYNKASTVVIDRNKTSYKIYIAKEENSFSAYSNLQQ